MSAHPPTIQPDLVLVAAVGAHEAVLPPTLGFLQPSLKRFLSPLSGQGEGDFGGAADLRAVVDEGGVQFGHRGLQG